MRFDQIEGRWLKQRWPKLRDQDLEAAMGRRDVTVWLIAQAYGLSAELVADQLDEWVAEHEPADFDPPGGPRRHPRRPPWSTVFDDRAADH